MNKNNHIKQSPVLLSWPFAAFRGSFFALILICFSSSLFAENKLFESPITKENLTEFRKIENALKQHKAIRANFKQEKKIKILRRPLRSSGHFIYDQKLGVYWHQAMPFETIVIANDQALVQKDEEGQVTKIDAKKQPVVKGFTEVFTSIFTGDTEKLKENFKIFFTAKEGEWTIGLEPRSFIVKKIIKKIVLTGSTTVKTVNITETNGDTTSLVFSETKTTPVELTTEEKKKFEY